MNDHFCMATQIFKESLEGIYLGGRMATICRQVAIQFFCSLSLRVRLPFRTWKGSTHGRKVVENCTLVPVLRMATRHRRGTLPLVGWRRPLRDYRHLKRGRIRVRLNNFPSDVTLAQDGVSRMYKK
jgi:hypothetical protein